MQVLMALAGKNRICKAERTMGQTRDTPRHMSMQARQANGVEARHRMARHLMGRVGGIHKKLKSKVRIVAICIQSGVAILRQDDLAKSWEREGR